MDEKYIIRGVEYRPVGDAVFPILRFPNQALAAKSCKETQAAIEYYEATDGKDWFYLLLDEDPDAWEKTAFDRKHGYIHALAADDQYRRLQKVSQAPPSVNPKPRE